KRAIRIFKDKVDGVAVARAVAERFREAPSKDVEQVEHIALADRVVAEKPGCLVLVLVRWRARDSPFVDAQELVIERPFRLHLMMRGLSHYRAFELPVSRHVIDQIVMPLGGL